MARFFLLLQQGVTIRRRAGCTVDSFLRQQLGAGPRTVEMIQSVILDGKPVDDIAAAIVRDGATLALSAAMPGLVGATMRRGGAYASLRSSITYRETGEARPGGDGWVTVKLFNLLMAELGPSLLRGQALVAAPALLALVADLPEDFWRGCRGIRHERRKIDKDQLLEKMRRAGAAAVLLSVNPEADRG